jgi:Carboxypeptidase regulatory-like domain
MTAQAQIPKMEPFMRRLAIFPIIVVLFLCSGALADDSSSAVQFTVLKDYSGKPVRNASVVMHQIDKLGRQAKGGLQLKTDAEGRASFDGVPYGKLRVQVLITGYQTFGQDYDINQPQTEITIRLKRPADQYSIYDDKNQAPQQAKPEEKKSGDDKKPEENQPPK